MMKQIKINKILSKLLLIGALVSPLTSYADYNNGSFYIDGAAGLGFTYDLPTGATTIAANAGYAFNRGLALEAGWTGLPSTQFGKMFNYNIYDIAVKGSIPFTNYFSLYGKLGTGVGYSTWSVTPAASNSAYWSSGSATTWVGLVGVGANFRLSNHLGIFVQNNSYIPFTSQAGSYGATNASMVGLEVSF